MLHLVDISAKKFTCVKCGNCCYDVTREQNSMRYGFNFQGDLVLNPKVSLAILYNEKYELEKNLRDYRLQARFYPGRVFFMKDHPFGFIYSYQLGVKKKKYCMFYDLLKRECKIHPIRPLVCRVYPLGCNALSGQNLIPESTCTRVKEMLHQVDPHIKVGDPVYYPNSQSQMVAVFPLEFYMLANVVNFNEWELKTIVRNLDSLFLSDAEISPSRVRYYDLLNFRDFIGWTKNNITRKIEKVKVERFSQELDYGKQSYTTMLVRDMVDHALKRGRIDIATM